MAKKHKKNDVEKLIPRRITFFGKGSLLPELDHVGWSEFTEAVMPGLRPHDHGNAFEICYIVSGTVTWFVEDKIFEVKPGELFITWPEEVHGGMDGVMQPCELYWICFRLDAKKQPFGLTENECRKVLEKFTQLPGRQCQAPLSITKHYQNILDAHKTPGSLAKMAVRAAMQHLFLEIFAAFKRPENLQHKPYSDKIRKALSHIEQESDRIAGIDEIAARAGLKSSYFRHRFQKETGFSPIEYLTHVRIKKAKSALLESEKSITDIAFDAGFNSSQYFATVFKKLVGLSPGAFRREHRSD